MHKQRYAVLWGAIMAALPCGPIWAFGSPMVVVTEATYSDTHAHNGSHELTFALDGLAATDVTWDVAVSVSAGWSATTGERSVTLSSMKVGQPSLVDIHVEPIHTKCPPKGLVVHLTFSDPTRYHYEVREQFYYRYGIAGLEPIDYEAYLVDYEAIDAGMSASRGCSQMSKASIYDDALPEPEKFGGMVPMSTTRTFTGSVVFWDARGHRSNSTGTRLPTCNQNVTSCAPGSAGCCWRPVPNAQVIILGPLPVLGEVCNIITDSTGAFSCTESQPNSADYRISIRAQHTPNTFLYTGSRVRALISGVVAQLVFERSSSTSSLNFGSIKVNDAGDSTSTIGNAFTAFVAADAAFGYLNSEGSETRHHYAGNAHLKINVTAGSNSTHCTNDVLNIQPAYSRALELVHLLGFIYMGKVTGCSGANPAYPTYLPGGYDTQTAEGNALRVGIPSLLVTLSRYNPATASTTSIFSSLYNCRGNGSNNANLASDERNNWHALWELVDTDTGNTSGAGSDLHDLTVKDVMDGLVALRDHSGSSGDNYTNAEQILTEVPYSTCVVANDCDPGDACVGYICYEGDPHGENIWDLAYNLCLDRAECPGWPVLGYLSTIVSSPCLGMYDDSYPFTGGFRSD